MSVSSSYLTFRLDDASSLAVGAFLGLAKMCSPLHGEAGAGLKLVLRGLLPSLLLEGEGPPRSLAVIRSNAVKFVHFLLATGGQEVSCGIIPSH